MAFDYVFWAAVVGDNTVRLTHLEGFSEDFELEEGIAHAHDYPDDARFAMSPDWPNSTILADHLSNISSLVVISPRLHDFVSTRADEKTEFLPTRVMDHKGKQLAERYWIVNPVGQAACLDGERCGVSKEMGISIEQMSHFAVVDAAVPRERRLFRMERLARYVLVHRELAKAIDAAGFTGNRWVEPSEILGRRIPADLTDLPPRA